jgi:uncharacterized RDD family membrane protein YckC
MFCPNCGKENDDRAMYCQVCGAGMAEKAAATVQVATVSYAGFWARFLAMVIDAIVVSVATGIVSAASFGVATIAVVFCGPWLYEAFMLSSEWQATVGKRAMSIVVTGADGGRISFARATGRHFAKWISGLILFIGFIMAAFTEKRQGLHDMIAETLVVNRTL